MKRKEQPTSFELNDLISSKDSFSINKKLKTYGVAVVPEYVKGQELTSLINEYKSMQIKGKNKSCPSVIRSIGGEDKDYFAYDQHLDKKNLFPDLNRFFSGDIIKDLIKKVVGVPCMANGEVYATFDLGKGHTVLPSHFDKTWNLKFMLYLDDILESGKGAFGVHPSTTGTARKQFRDWFNQNKKFGAIEVGSDKYYSMTNFELPASLSNFVEIHGVAGTLIIFSTDCFHSASKLDIGQTGRILRAHTYPQREPLGLGDRLSVWSRHYSRGEDWENGSRQYSPISFSYWLEYSEFVYSRVSKSARKTPAYCKKSYQLLQSHIRGFVFKMLKKALELIGIKDFVLWLFKRQRK